MPEITDPAGLAIAEVEMLNELMQEVRAMRADFAVIQETLTKVQEAIEPAVADLRKSPIGKMMGL